MTEDKFPTVPPLAKGGILRRPTLLGLESFNQPPDLVVSIMAEEESVSPLKFKEIIDRIVENISKNGV